MEKSEKNLKNGKKNESMSNLHVKESNSKLFLEEKRKNFEELIDTSIIKENFKLIEEDLKNVFSNNKMKNISKLNEIDSINKEKIKEPIDLINILNKFSLIEYQFFLTNENIKNLIIGFSKELKGLLDQHNYNDNNNQIYFKLNDEFRIKTFDDKLIERYISNEDDLCAFDNFVYIDGKERYKGEKIIVKQDNTSIKKRHGFGYYFNRTEKIDFYGVFNNDEYDKGFLETIDSYYNGKFDYSKEYFEGVYNSKLNDSDDYFIMFGKSYLKEKLFEGIFIKVEKEKLYCYIGTLENQKKNSKNSILIEYDIKNSIFDPNKLQYKFSFGEFKNDQPNLVDEINGFYIYENNSLLKISLNKIFSLFNYDNKNKILSQGEIKDNTLNKNASVFDLKNKIYFNGNMENGNYKDEGNLITFTNDKLDPDKIIFINGNFNDKIISNSKVFIYEKKKTKTEIMTMIHNAEFTEEFEIKYGKIEFKDNEYYEGIFENYLKSGHGKYVYSDGSSYEGEWKEDKKSGKGIYYDKNKNEYRGVWVDDMLKK